MMNTYWRIISTVDNEIVANAIPELEQAREIQYFLELEHPEDTFTIESYAFTQVKPGFGRDPDLH